MRSAFRCIKILPLVVWLIASICRAGDYAFEGNVNVTTNFAVGATAVPTNEPPGSAYVAGNLNVTGTNTAAAFVGDGAGLTNLPWSFGEGFTDTGSMAVGSNVTASGTNSLAQGKNATANGNYSSAQGIDVTALGLASHAEGQGTIATVAGTHAEGQETQAGNDTQDGGWFAHAEGRRTRAIGDFSHAEGDMNEASGEASHAEGNDTVASGITAHAEGFYTTASGFGAHAQGGNTEAPGHFSHAEGRKTKASGAYSHAEGSGNQDGTEWTISEAAGDNSHVEGHATYASGFASHAEGDWSQAQGDAAHAEGLNTFAIGIYSHAEGDGSTADGHAAHAEGGYTHAGNSFTHAEGVSSEASGYAAHAEGGGTVASGDYAHAAGQNANAANANSFVWSDGESIASDADGQFTVHASGGIRLLGGAISGDGSGLTNLPLPENGAGSFDQLIAQQLFLGGISPPVNEDFAHFPMNDDAQDTQVTDASGNGNNGVLQGGHTTEDRHVPGVVGGALDLDGSSDKIKIPDAVATAMREAGTGTLATWFRPDNIPGFAPILGIAGGGCWEGVVLAFGTDRGGYGIYFDNFANCGGAPYIQTKYNVGHNFSGEWHHVAMVQNGENLAFYFDGIDVTTNVTHYGSPLPSDQWFANLQHSSELFAGYAEEWGYLNGAVDDVRVSVTPYTAEQIDALYNNGSGTESAIETNGMAAPINHQVVSTNETFTTSHDLDSLGDLAVEGKLEVDGDAFFDSDVQIAGNLNVSGTQTAVAFAGDGAGLTNLNAVITESDPQALLASGARAMAGNLNAGGHSITNVSLGVSGAARFDQGIAHIEPLGDLDMGIYVTGP